MALIHVGSVECVTVDDAAELLEVSRHQVRDLVRKHKLLRRGETQPMLIDRLSVERYRRERGFWNPGRVKGGKRAAVRMGTWEGD